jgi:hypothetical protein
MAVRNALPQGRHGSLRRPHKNNPHMSHNLISCHKKHKKLKLKIKEMLFVLFVANFWS